MKLLAPYFFVLLLIVATFGLIALLGGCSVPTAQKPESEVRSQKSESAIMPPKSEVSIQNSEARIVIPPAPLKTNVIFSWNTIYVPSNGVVTGLVTATNLLVAMTNWTVVCEFPAQLFNQWTNQLQAGAHFYRAFTSWTNI